jgi:SAM-dependent methyltransferase
MPRNSSVETARAADADGSRVGLESIRKFWEANPLAVAAIEDPPGTSEFFRRYDQLREANESVEFSYKLHEYRENAGRKVLDIGCGNGYVASRYAREGADTFGIDLTEAAVRLSRQRFDLLGLKGGFATASAEELPFANETFDCVCSMGVLHHTPDPERAIKEIHRVLKPGGRVILMLYHRDSALYQVRFRLEALGTKKPRHQLVNEVDGAGNPKGDVYSRRQAVKLLRDFQRHELQVGLLRPWMVVPRGSRFIPQWFLRPFDRRWGWFLYAKAMKA